MDALSSEGCAEGLIGDNIMSIGTRHEIFEIMPEDADVPVFVISGDDPLCGLVVQQYANRLQQSGEADDDMVAAIREHARYMQVYYTNAVEAVVDAAEEVSVAEEVFDELVDTIKHTEEEA